MRRFITALICAIALFPAVARGETLEERVERLEREARAERERHAKEVEDLTRRITELEGTRQETELDRLIREAEEHAAAAEEGGPAAPPLVTGQSLANALNPRITAFGDFAYRMDNRPVYGHHHHEGEDGTDHEEPDDADRIDDRASLRSFELDLRADIDPFAKGVAILGMHEDLPGEYEVDPEEVYATFETLPYGFRGKVGKYLASFGTVNRLHPHDLPQATSPLFHEEWFGHEGLNSTGGELSWLVPQSLVDSVELVAGVMNGEADLFAGGESGDPAWLGRLEVFETASDSTWFSVGTSHLYGKTDADGAEPVRVSGIDVLMRWRPADRPLETSLVLQAEAYHLDRKLADEETARGLGGYALAQYQPMRDLYLGLRYDYVDPTEEFAEGKAWAIGAWITWYTSEFLRFRIGYEHREYRDGENLDTVWLQLTFVFGSHPVEPYWFNK